MVRGLFVCLVLLLSCYDRGSRFTVRGSRCTVCRTFLPVDKTFCATWKPSKQLCLVIKLDTAVPAVIVVLNVWLKSSYYKICNENRRLQNLVYKPTKCTD
jgi:hypothetical protein